MMTVPKNFFTIFSDKLGFWLEFTEKGKLISEGPFRTLFDAQKTGENRGWLYIEKEGK